MRPFCRHLLLASMMMLLFLTQGCEQPPLVQRLQKNGNLHIATIAGPLSCYLGEEGPAGLEYELAGTFARKLGLEPVFTVYPTRAEALQAVQTGREDMAAGFIISYPLDEKQYRYSTGFIHTQAQFAHTMGHPRYDPEYMKDMLVVVPEGGYANRLLQKAQLAPHALEGATEESILSLVDMEVFTYTLTNSAQIKAHANLFPRLVAGTKLHHSLEVRWLFPRFYDSSLKNEADAFLRQERSLLQKLASEYIEQLPTRNFVTRRDFWKHVHERLPEYIELFRLAEKETGIDWRLLAAIGYQESHWNNAAISPTGVRGIMMLTRDTARQQKIGNRLDPAQSIPGGARHLLWMEQRIPKRIQGEDLLWFTLASYNIGYGHLEDARILTQRQGGNPDKWEDVKQRLPLLDEKEYYSTVKHGQARGKEPVTYVENIRYYYKLLVYWDNIEKGLDCTNDTSQRRLALKN